MKSSRIVLAIAACALSVSQLHAAFSVPIVNWNFENAEQTVAPGYTGANGILAAPGWEIDGDSGGVWNIEDFPGGFWNADAFQEGKQVGWITSASPGGGSSTMSQVLAATLQDNVVYTLSGQVGHPIGFSTTYTVALIAGSTVLDSISGVAFEGYLVPFTFDFDSTGSSYIGQTLQIRLSSLDAQTAFDSITLTGTPEPASLIVWSIVAMSIGCCCCWLRNRKPAA